MNSNKNASLPAQKHPMPISRRVKANVSNGLQIFSQTASFIMSSFFTLFLTHCPPTAPWHSWSSCNTLVLDICTSKLQLERISPERQEVWILVSFKSPSFMSLSQWVHLFVFQPLPQAQALPCSLPCFIFIIICSTLPPLSLSVSQSCLILCNTMDCNQPGSSVHGILQTRVLEWVAISLSSGSSPIRNWTHISLIAGRFFTSRTTREALQYSLSFLLFLFSVLSFSTRIPDLWRPSLHHRKRLGSS